ncbi:unnamed protein product [Notodromas monacha]|uniref:DUF7802 domain-containing protein n=1 Tax=Notodromas monacha TaxID=399045 RepID=A0A7R9BHR8_9CRUS|nr:unnamed protein product [Notodromas monacha]CAG0915723.1 unnamed protein product [Notodromas monacha]
MCMDTQYGIMYSPNLWDWFIAFNHPKDVWRRQPTYLISEYTYYLGGLLTLIHALRMGGRYKYLWLASLLHGLFVENICFWFPEYIDNYWHSQTTVVLLGRRLPLHIIFLYPTFIYTASASVARLRLPKWAEPFAVGLTVVLIDIPYDTTAVRFLHWAWHDTDANIYDRHYWVPWNSYYFHATFAAAFTILLNFYRKLVTKEEDRNVTASCGKEVLCSFLVGVTAMPLGVLMFVPVYHPLHDLFGIHNENCFFIILVIFLTIVWRADRHAGQASRPQKGVSNGWINELVLLLLVHYSVYLGCVSLADPGKEVSVGMHEVTGPCHEKVFIPTILGIDLPRRKYFCTSDYDEGYFDFHCLPGGRAPADGLEWYTICGVPFANRMEYIAMEALIFFLALNVFFQMHYASGTFPQAVKKVQQAREKKKQR